MDKGAKFVIENFNKSLRLSKEVKELSHLEKKIHREYLRIKDITKTGDMYNHFKRFSDGTHKYEQDFAIFKKYDIIPNEDLAKILKDNYPDEINNISSISLTSYFIVGNTYTSHEINNIFGVTGRGGGIRVSNSTNTIVISDLHRSSLYTNKWVGNTLYYVGSGQVGDQTLTRVNKSLYEASNDGKTIHIFESPETNKYIYHGIAEVDGYPEVSRQLDINKNMRDVFVFKLKLINSKKPVVIDEDTYDKITKQREMNVSKIDNQTLKQLAENARRESSSRTVETKVYDRDPSVNEYVKQRANGICDLCDQPAPFITKDGKPFLECHHVIYLSEGGTDTIDNAVALCPNCHRKIHSLELEDDKKKLIRKLYQYTE